MRRLVGRLICFFARSTFTFRTQPLCRIIGSSGSRELSTVLQCGELHVYSYWDSEARRVGDGTQRTGDAERENQENGGEEGTGAAHWEGIERNDGKHRDSMRQGDSVGG